MKLSYDPWNFVDLYETELGKKIWEFLIRKENIIRAETAIDLKRTCIEALERPLNKEFSSQFVKLHREDLKLGANKILRLKQMIGHMVGQIMISKGFEKDKQGVILPMKKKKQALVFSKATRFKRPDNE